MCGIGRRSALAGNRCGGRVEEYGVGVLLRDRPAGELQGLAGGAEVALSPGAGVEDGVLVEPIVVTWMRVRSCRRVLNMFVYALSANKYTQRNQQT